MEDEGPTRKNDRLVQGSFEDLGEKLHFRTRKRKKEPIINTINTKYLSLCGGLVVGFKVVLIDK